MRAGQRRPPTLIGTFADPARVPEREPHILVPLAHCVLAFLLVLLLADLILRATFPALPRLDANFSSPYLERTIASMHREPVVAVMGDSVLWGYRLPPERSAVSILRAHGVPLINLAFEGGSMANTYALLRFMENTRIRPRAVLFNVNLKVFNSADPAYAALYPAVEQSAWSLLTPHQRSLLHPTRKNTFDARVDDCLSHEWALYGLRNDIREILFGDVDAANALKNMVNRLSGEAGRSSAAHVPTPEKFLGTYDLSPLTETNIEVSFLRDTIALLRLEEIPAVAVLTPTNHALLHGYIDVPEYDAQRRFIARLLRRGGIRVLDYDRAFPARDFFDNDHLTEAGNRTLAVMLRRDALR